MNDANSTVPPALMELIFDPETHKAETHLSGLAQELIDEGMPLRSVARGLAGSIVKLITEEYPKGNDEFLWAWHFLRELEKGFGTWRKHLDNVDDMAAQIIRNREAGGSGNPYQ